MQFFFKRMRCDDRGLETVEYAIILGLIVLAVFGALVAIGGWVSGVYSGVQSAVGA